MSALPHYCPNCGYEYESWIEICPDCGVLVKSREEKGNPSELASGKRGFAADEDPHWTVVSNMPNAIIGGLVKSQLEDAGIPVLMMRAPSAAVAEFSGNDYVPHVLLVPRSKAIEARALIDSRPDNSFDNSLWDDDAISDDTDDDDWYADTEPATDISDLRRLWGTDSTMDTKPERPMPDGWTLLPTESDVRNRTEQQRARLDSQSWYWQGASATAAQSQENVPVSEESPYSRNRPRARSYQDDLAEYNRDDAQWTGPSKWIRIFYGILLLALSLPFIFQLLSQLTNIFK
jgi:predicted  nucleic acid-binding Zn-ribbon protein